MPCFGFIHYGGQVKTCKYRMKETVLYIGLILLGLYFTYLYFTWKMLRIYAKTILSEHNPNNIICLIVKGDKK